MDQQPTKRAQDDSLSEDLALLEEDDSQRPEPQDLSQVPQKEEEDLLRLESDMNAPVRETPGAQPPTQEDAPDQTKNQGEASQEEEDEEEEDEEDQVSDEPPPVQEGERFRITVHLVAKDYLSSMMFNYYFNGWYNTALAVLVFFVGIGTLFWGSYLVAVICLLYPFALLLINRIRFGRYCKKTYPTARVFDLIGNDEIGFLVYSHQTGRTNTVDYPQIKSVIETKRHYFLTCKQNTFQIIFPKRETPKTAVSAMKGLLREHLTYQQYHFKKQK